MKKGILNNDFPKTLLRNKKEINYQVEIATYFNIFFTNIGSNLANKIPQSEKHFIHHILTNVLIYFKIITYRLKKLKKDFHL